MRGCWGEAGLWTLCSLAPLLPCSSAPLLPTPNLLTSLNHAMIFSRSITMKYPDLNHFRWMKQYVVAQWRPDSKENRVFFWAFALTRTSFKGPGENPKLRIWGNYAGFNVIRSERCSHPFACSRWGTQGGYRHRHSRRTGRWYYHCSGQARVILVPLSCHLAS